MAASAKATVQDYRVFIKATPQVIWDALTKSEWTKRYGYGGTVQFDLRPGGAYKAMSEAGMDGTWRLLMDPQIAAEGFTRVTYTRESA